MAVLASLHGNDFYYEIGPASSAGLNGTWHQYSVESGSARTVNFIIDEEQVATIDFPLLPSEDPPMAVAEKVATSNELGVLGPVEFRNISYLTVEGWHQVDSLISLNSCGINMNCSDPNLYGVSLEETIRSSQAQAARSKKEANCSGREATYFSVS